MTFPLFSICSVSRTNMLKWLSNLGEITSFQMLSEYNTHTTSNSLISVYLQRFWWAKVHGLCAIGDFEELERFSRQKKSPIGYEVYIVCMYSACYLGALLAFCRDMYRTWKQERSCKICSKVCFRGTFSTLSQDRVSFL